ncbi:MAG: OmpH family outer membrane protein [Crocinitomicaceae bacterium]
MLKNTYFLFGFILICTSCSEEHGRNIGVVDLPSMYESFDYQIELSNEYEEISAKSYAVIDSLEKDIKNYEFALNASTVYNDSEKSQLFEMTYVSFLDQQKREQFKLDSIGDDFSNKVWAQLNSYVQEFGSENNYDVIIGMKGDGNVMYVKDGANITNEVISYSNDKYNGR